MDVSFQHHEHLIRPWRLAAFVAAAVAAIELLVLVVVGGALIAKPSAGEASRPVHKAAATNAARTKATRLSAAKQHRAAPPVAHRARGRVSVLVLNGSSRQGAAAATAARASRKGYRIGGVGNAPRTDFTRSIVMYRRGFEGEGRRLARDLGVGIVGPLDGMRTADLHGAHTVVVIGA